MSHREGLRDALMVLSILALGFVGLTLRDLNWAVMRKFDRHMEPLETTLQNDTQRMSTTIVTPRQEGESPYEQSLRHFEMVKWIRVYYPEWRFADADATNTVDERGDGATGGDPEKGR